MRSKAESAKQPLFLYVMWTTVFAQTPMNACSLMVDVVTSVRTGEVPTGVTVLQATHWIQIGITAEVGQIGLHFTPQLW